MTVPTSSFRWQSVSHLWVSPTSEKPSQLNVQSAGGRHRSSRVFIQLYFNKPVSSKTMERWKSNISSRSSADALHRQLSFSRLESLLSVECYIPVMSRFPHSSSNNIFCTFHQTNSNVFQIYSYKLFCKMKCFKWVIKICVCCICSCSIQKNSYYALDLLPLFLRTKSNFYATGLKFGRILSRYVMLIVGLRAGIRPTWW